MSGTYELLTGCEVKKAGYWAKIERDEYAAILTERLVSKGFYILPRYFALFRIKNYLFISRDEKENQLFL